MDLMNRTVSRLALAAGLVFGAAATHAATPAELATKAGCAVCHQPTAKGLGPSYQEIAKKYKGQAGAPATMAERVRKGSVGVFGKVPMTPTPPARISDADLKTVIDWILKTP